MNFDETRYEIRNALRTNPKLKFVACWEISSFVFVIAIRIARTRNFHLTGALDYLQGTLPNFFAATGICSLVFLYNRLFPGNNNSLRKKLLFSALFTFTGLTLWEIVQSFMGYAIDLNDIMMTALGCILTTVFILSLRLERK